MDSRSLSLSRAQEKKTYLAYRPAPLKILVLFVRCLVSSYVIVANERSRGGRGAAAQPKVISVQFATIYYVLATLMRAPELLNESRVVQDPQNRINILQD